MGSCRSVYNRGWRVELECSLLVDRDAAGREIELIEPIDELCYIFAAGAFVGELEALKRKKGIRELCGIGGFDYFMQDFLMVTGACEPIFDDRRD
jgi:hypothetical protein